MASLTTAVTISAEELFELCKAKVDKSLHEALTREIDRRWPHGFTLHIHLAPKPDQSTD